MSVTFEDELVSNLFYFLHSECEGFFNCITHSWTYTDTCFSDLDITGMVNKKYAKKFHFGHYTVFSTRTENYSLGDRVYVFDNTKMKQSDKKQDEIKQLKEQLEQMSKKLSELEKQ